MNKIELKEILLTLDYFTDNEFLDSYCDLIVSNLETVSEKFITQSHHVIPCKYFNLKYGYKRTTNRKDMKKFDKDNYRVNLKYKDHILAHYYLCLCTEGDLKKSMCNAIVRMLYCNPNLKLRINKESVENLIEELNLSDINSIYKLGRAHTDKWKKEHSKKLKNRIPYTQTSETKQKISATLKQKYTTGELKCSIKNRSHPGKSNPMYGSTYIWVNDGNKQYRWDKNKEIPDGYSLGILSKPSVLCYSLDGRFIKEYASADEASKEVGVSGSMIRKVCRGKNKTAGGYKWKYKVV